MDNTEGRIKEAEVVIEFCKRAVEDAIYTEDGLDGSTGEALIKEILDYYKKYRPDLHQEHLEEQKKISKQPEI